MKDKELRVKVTKLENKLYEELRFVRKFSWRRGLDNVITGEYPTTLKEVITMQDEKIERLENRLQLMEKYLNIQVVETPPQTRYQKIKETQ